jgi:hypothetical protein
MKGYGRIRVHYCQVIGLLAAHAEANDCVEGGDFEVLRQQESLGVDAVLVVDCSGEVGLVGRAG